MEGFSNFSIAWNDIFIFNKCDSLFRFDFIGKKGRNVFPKFFAISYKFSK